MLFCLQTHLKFINFQNFLYEDKYEVLVLNNYLKTKNNRSYYVLSLQYKDIIIYTTTSKKINSNHILLNFAAKEKLSFYEYFKSKFYLPSYNIVELKEFKDNFFVNYFLDQHKDEKIKQLYGALFFAKSINKELRNDVNYYGIAHLIAISGYHLGLIYSIFFFIFSIIYKYFQKRFFPYRSIHFDLGIIIFIILALYFYQIGMIASYFRSFIMAILGFYFVIRAIKLLSFLHLLLAFLICVAINPSLIFSVGFFFSCLGVFYIYLFLYHFKINNIYMIILLEISVFFAMITPVLYFFPLLSFQQLFGIILTPLFVIFYPLVLFLHIINQGNLLDGILINFLNFKLFAIDFKVDFVFFISYIFLSLLSIFHRYLAIFVISINMIFYFYLGFL
ncbi:ComEC/Rec2 family competence protein [Campylobacter sp. MG1]|uniref:ComEC/Rec2 family competence protein n=1 Tax=Campylobacter sp. MG1 TaxID=2976332 RepID=UPI00226D0180|nr:ComEC/Rec2 family competence protein [Campylobacter sp. MG1]